MRDFLNFFYLLIVINVLTASPIYAAATLPHSTTYDCSEWTQGESVTCDEFTIGGSWMTADGALEQIISEANYSDGNGGRGQRHWYGPGENDNSGGLDLPFTNGQTEFWMRIYMRFEEGFYFDTYSGLKYLYFRHSDGAAHNYILIGMGTDGGIDYYTQVGGMSHYRNASNYGWEDIHGGTTSDGTWHCYEIYIKSETGEGTNDGILRVWVDEELIIESTSVDHGLNSNSYEITSVLIGSNAKWIPDEPDFYHDYDDIAICDVNGPAGGFIQDANGNDMIGPADATSTGTLSIGSGTGSLGVGAGSGSMTVSQ